MSKCTRVQQNWPALVYTYTTNMIVYRCTPNVKKSDTQSISKQKIEKYIKVKALKNWKVYEAYSSITMSIGTHVQVARSVSVVFHENKKGRRRI